MWGFGTVGWGSRDGERGAVRGDSRWGKGGDLAGADKGRVGLDWTGVRSESWHE